MSELSADPYVTAHDLGCVVIEPGPFELFVDLDGDATQLEIGLTAAISVGLPIRVTKIVPSKTPGHVHVYLDVDNNGEPLTPERRIALQAVLGSDLKRELFSLARIMLNVPRAPTIFFETAEED